MPNQTSILGQNTNVAGVQVHLGAHLVKAVQEGANQGAGAPPLPPLRPTLQEVVHLMPLGRLHAVLTKNTTPNHHTQAI